MSDLLTRRQGLALIGALALSGCAPAIAPPRPDADVLILGGGLSGLYAARLLKQAGASVLVLEANADRIGGRLWTLDEVPGRPEGGGQQVGASYARIRAECADLGLSLFGRSERPQPPYMHVGGIGAPGEDWASHPANPLPEALKAADPGGAFFRAALAANPFADEYAWRDPGAASVDIAADAFLRDAGFSEEAIRLVDLSLNANSLSTYSMTNLFRTLALFSKDRSMGPTENVSGGSQRLPEAMAASLGGAYRPGVRIDAISTDGGGVSVRDASGKVWRAPFAVCTLPYPALRTVAFEPGLPDLDAEAIATMPYTEIVQLHLIPERRFWEEDGLNASMWTDTALERIFAYRDEASGEIAGLTAWINGTGTAGLATAAEADLERLAQDTLRTLRPASEGRVRLARVMRWTGTGSYSGGAYMHFAPGQASRWAGRIGAPLGNRLFFAGEHLSFLHTGMEGAMESGEAAAFAVQDALGV